MHDNNDIAAGQSDLAELVMLFAIATIELGVSAGFAVAIGVWALVLMGA